MTTPPLNTTLESPKSVGQAGKAGTQPAPGVGTDDLPPLKVPKKYRLSRETLSALELLRAHWHCDETAAVELAIMRAAAWVMTWKRSGVPTPEAGGVGSNV